MSLKRDARNRFRDALSANLENERRRRQMLLFRAGPGIHLRVEDDKMVISLADESKRKSGLSIPWVKELPEIPTTAQTTRIVFWATSTQIEGATGDGQLWTASTGDTRWYPLAKYTTKDGVPVA